MSTHENEGEDGTILFEVSVCDDASSANGLAIAVHAYQGELESMVSVAGWEFVAMMIATFEQFCETLREEFGHLADVERDPKNLN